MSKELPKKRIELTEAQSAEILFASDYTCCKCRIPHLRVQVHHIDDDPSNNDPSNLAALCLACHDETQVHGGFGRALRPDLVRLYRDQWHKIVQENRTRQAAAMSGACATAAFGAVPIMFAVNPPARDVIITIAVLAALLLVAFMVCRAYDLRRA